MGCRSQPVASDRVRGVALSQLALLQLVNGAVWALLGAASTPGWAWASGAARTGLLDLARQRVAHGDVDGFVELRELDLAHEGTRRLLLTCAVLGPSRGIRGDRLVDRALQRRQPALGIADGHAMRVGQRHLGGAQRGAQHRVEPFQRPFLRQRVGQQRVDILLLARGGSFGGGDDSLTTTANLTYDGQAGAVAELLGVKIMKTNMNPTQQTSSGVVRRAIVCGVGALVAFSSYLGMTWWIAVVFFVMYFALALAITRMRVELGAPIHDLHFTGPEMILTRTMGSKA